MNRVTVIPSSPQSIQKTLCHPTDVFISKPSFKTTYLIDTFPKLQI